MNPARGPRERFRHPSTRQFISSARRGRGALAGRRTIRCAGTAVGNFPSAASRRLRSRMLLCSVAESFFECSLQNLRLRGPAPGLPQPGTGQSRPESRPSGRPREPLPAPWMRDSARETCSSTCWAMAAVNSRAKRSISERKEASCVRLGIGDFPIWTMARSPRCTGASVLSGGAGSSERKNALLAEQAFELVPRLFLELLLLRLRLRLRSLLRVLLDLLRLLLRRLLRPPGIDSQRAPHQRGSSFLHDLIYRRLEVEIHYRRAPRRTHQPELHRDGIGRVHLAAGDRRDHAGRERDRAGQVEGAVDAQSSAEGHLRLRARNLEGLLQPGDALLDGDAEGKILAETGLASLSRLACEPEGKRLRQRTGHRC